jgi:hypothetical protein
LGGEDREMGKKQGRKREREEEEDDEGQEIDLELEAELAALQQIQHEKEENEEDEEDDETGTSSSTKRTNYNKEGLVHCNESLGVTHLPFIETMSICEYELHVTDENDDLEREVGDP